MKRYVAFLRGVNISGKNKIAMGELKIAAEALGFSDVKTYLNSGNIAFSSELEQEKCLELLQAMMKDTFALSIPVFVIEKEALEDILNNAPAWWGGEQKEIYDNLILILPPTTFDEVFRQIGEPKESLEQIKSYKQAIFWSFSRKDYQKTNWWKKTASASVGSFLTIRTANTVRKMVEMGEQKTKP